ncbi:uncharacterized protein LOC118739242 [Rhagoletis pomonella]|uniref:uncharacterized protein LOC118739242 n=1 Tax=Rhagoletis pomonella TaxID=28610 RepID=UPI0017863A91|nr:uncharacterized protein LOC118739242 [Rhagoletis pomonella]
MDEEIFANICENVRCTLLAADMDKLNYVRELQARVQYQNVFTKVLGSDDYVDEIESEWMTRVREYSSEKQSSEDLYEAELEAEEELLETEEEDEEEKATMSKSIESEEELDVDVWQGYFKGYQILSEGQEGAFGDSKKCIELVNGECDASIDTYLRAGIRCFAIDLFYGTFVENQSLILRLRESELSYSKEIGFPISSTIFAKLSPRLQYTGLMEPPDLVVILNKGDEITLTNKREWSTHCSKKRVYVNAGFLFHEVNIFDYICIGCDVQVSVRKKDANLRCVVEVGGEIRSRLPVLFPSRCSKFLASQEELEDITFCKEVGINVLVSYIGGTQEYFDNLQYALKTLGCEKVRLYARIVINEVKGCGTDVNWMADHYDGFVIALSPSQQHPEPAILHLCPAAEELMKRAYLLQKVIVLEPSLIANKQLIVEPAHYRHIFLYPDKYIMPCNHTQSSFHFFYLQNSISELLIEEALSKVTYCDRSLTGSDSLARSVVCASYEMNAPLIFVCSLTGRMAAKIAHFRPKAHIILITRMKSAETFISMHHNVSLLYYNGKADENCYRSLYKHLLFGLLYAKSQQMLNHNENVIFVYSENASTRLPDKYVAYKFHTRYFPQHLDKILFSKFPRGFFEEMRKHKDDKSEGGQTEKQGGKD